MVQRTVLKVDISCQKCKKKLLKAVSGLQGVDKIEIDGSKGTLTVTGDADPYEIIIRTKKVGKFVEVISVGPPPPPPKPQQDGQKKPDEKKADKKAQPQDQDQDQDHIHTPHSHYPVCVVQVVRTWDEPNPSCSIM